MKRLQNQSSSGRANKRRRVLRVEPSSVVIAREQAPLPQGAPSLPSFFPFTYLPQDCQVLILQYLSCQDLVEFEMVSQYCRDLCSDKSLPQARTGTIYITKRMDMSQLFHFLQQKRASFESNPRRTRLKLTSISRINSFMMDQARRFLHGAQLTNVTSLDISFRSNDRNRNIKNSLLRDLLLLVPNLRELDMSYAGTNLLLDYWCFGMRTRLVAQHCMNLESFRHDGALIAYSGFGLEQFENLKELYLENCLIIVIDNVPGDSLLRCCKPGKLERVSLKNAMVTRRRMIDTVPHRERLLDSAVMEFVLATPSLKWFRSDLTPASIAVLKEQRPDIQFVS